MKKHHALFGILVLLVFSAACTAQREVKAPAPPPVTQQPPGKAPAALQPAPQTTLRAFDESLLRGQEFLLEAPGGQGVRVRDRVLGELGLDERTREVVEAFLSQAAAGSLEPSTLVPRWKDYLEQWAHRAKKEGSVEGRIRVGLNLPEKNGLILVPVRIIGPTNDSKGWVALDVKGETPLVSDVQLVPIPKETGTYDPEESR